MFSFRNLYKAGLLCCKGVMWKASTQRYVSSLIENTIKSMREILSGKWKTKGFNRFSLIERGKKRNICSVHISERVIQRCLCDNLLVPVFSSAFIYDNAASLKYKGIDFAMDRFECHLQRHFRKYGLEGFALVFDLSDFFNSAPHDPINKELDRRVEDSRLVKLSKDLMENYGPVGFGLGSQVSQIDALMVLNSLDHYVKEKLRIKGYGRYMDDGYLIHHSCEYLEYCLEAINEFCDALGVKLNQKKTKIIPLSKGVIFLKSKFILTETGKVIRRANKKSAKVMRRKLHSFKKWVLEGTFTMADVKTAMESWKGHMKRCDSHYIRRAMQISYNEIFGDLERAGYI